MVERRLFANRIPGVRFICLGLDIGVYYVHYLMYRDSLAYKTVSLK